MGGPAGETHLALEFLQAVAGFRYQQMLKGTKGICVSPPWLPVACGLAFVHNITVFDQHGV